MGIGTKLILGAAAAGIIGGVVAVGAGSVGLASGAFNAVAGNIGTAKTLGALIGAGAGCIAGAAGKFLLGGGMTSILSGGITQGPKLGRAMVLCAFLGAAGGYNLAPDVEPQPQPASPQTVPMAIPSRPLLR